MEAKQHYMIENSTLRIGGNTIFVWLGKRIEKFAVTLTQLGASMIAKNNPKLVTNPTAKLYNPFTLIISFTVDSNSKYQIVLEGDYKQKYKDCADGAIDLSENDIFMIINQNEKLWFKKE